MLQVIDPNIVRLMKKFGQTFKYYRASLCSCVAENNGHFDPACSCIQGFYYEAPTTVKALRNDVTRKVEHTPNGVIYNGDLRLTIPKYVDGVEQRIYYTLDKGDVFVDSKKLRRDTDICRRGVRDTLLAFDVVEILRVAYKNTVYVEGTDYTLSKAETTPHGRTVINWVDGRGPEEGAYYTVDFLALQQFKVFDGDYRFGGTDEEELPRTAKCVFRKYFETNNNPLDTVNIDHDIYQENQAPESGYILHTEAGSHLKLEDDEFRTTEIRYDEE